MKLIYVCLFYDLNRFICIGMTSMDQVSLGLFVDAFLDQNLLHFDRMMRTRKRKMKLKKKLKKRTKKKWKNDDNEVKVQQGKLLFSDEGVFLTMCYDLLVVAIGLMKVKEKMKQHQLGWIIKQGRWEGNICIISS